MLTDQDIREIAPRMKVPLERICFKDELKEQPIKYNRTYIINLQNELSDEGDRNDGTHWVALQVQKCKNGTIRPMYLDSYGVAPPTQITDFVGQYVPYNTADLQSLVESVCGYYCLAWSHYINAYDDRTRDIYTDTEDFISHFDDLNKSMDYKKNEFVLKLFFQSDNPELNKDINIGLDGGDIDRITEGNKDRIEISQPLTLNI